MGRHRGNKIMFTSPETMVISSLVSGVCREKNKTSVLVKNPFTTDSSRNIHLYVSLYSFERLMKRPFLELGNQGTTRGNEKILWTLVGIKPTTSGLDLPLLCPVGLSCVSCENYKGDSLCCSAISN